MKNKQIHLIGNVNLDIIMKSLQDWPQSGSEILLNEREIRVGGAIGNTALSLAALGLDATLHTCVGDDIFGDYIADNLTRSGYNIKQCASPTAFSVGVGFVDGERSFLTFPGHLINHNSTPDVETFSGQADSNLLLGGYFLMTTLRGGLAVRLLEKAKRIGMTTFLDFGHPPEGWSKSVRDEINRLIPVTDYVLPNERELADWIGTSGIESALQQIERAPCRIIVKRGQAGASYLSAGKIHHYPAPKIETVADTVGAGDVFNAGFIAALAKDLKLHECVATATTAASLAIATSPRRYPTWSDVMNCL